MSRSLCIGLVCLALAWANGVNRVEAQADMKYPNTNNLTRVTYPIADLIVLPEDHSFRDIGKPRREPASPDALAERLIKSITGTIAPGTWKCDGGAGKIEYFPMGMALVVKHCPEVQEQVGALLADLHRLLEVQVAVELRLVQVNPKVARELEQYLQEKGQKVRAYHNVSNLSPGGGQPIRSLDDKQFSLVLEALQGDRSTHLMQAPKITIYNGQHAAIGTGTYTAPGVMPKNGFMCDLQSVVEPQQKSVRLSLDLELAGRQSVKAAGTFALAPSRTLFWRLGETKDRQILFMLAMPRVIIAEEEATEFGSHFSLQPPVHLLTAPPCPLAKEVRALEEENAKRLKESSCRPPVVCVESLTTSTAQGQPASAQARAIEYRLRQPISLYFKNIPLRQAVESLSIESGIQIAMDEAALKDAAIKLDTPMSIKVEDIGMQSALNLLLQPLRLTYVVENNVLTITTEAKRAGKLLTVTYKVEDLVVELSPTFEGQEKGKTPDINVAAKLMELISRAVEPDSWTEVGGRGTIQYSPNEAVLRIKQSAEVHEEVQTFLEALRRLQDIKVNAEIRFVHASAYTAQKWRQMMSEQGDALTDPTHEPAFVSMNAEQMQGHLELMQADRASFMIQAPKAILFSGQHMPFECVQTSATEFRTSPPSSEKNAQAIAVSLQQKILGGWRCDLRPVVSPDRRSVQLDMKAEHFTKDEGVERITKAEKTFNVPDQTALVWYLGATVGGQHLFVVVTPRIHVRD